MPTRHMRKTLAGIIFAPSVANLSAPTVAEITAGTILHTQLVEVNGWQFSNSPIATPDFNSTFTSQIEGEDTADASSFTFHELDTYAANLIRLALAKGTVGVLIFSPYVKAPIAASRVETWSVKISGNNRQWTAANESAKYAVSAAILAPPVQDATVAA